MSDQPNPISVGLSILKAQRADKPHPSGTGFVDAPDLADVLTILRAGGIPTLPNKRGILHAYRDRMERLDPDDLSHDGALAFWLNLYNAGALSLAADAFESSTATVLRIPGALDAPWATIAGASLSLNDIEHGKIRRFGDPRIHGALVCGSASCPTLRYEPFGENLNDQLDDQMRSFLAGGGAAVDQTTGTLRLSRVFLWYGGDFTRPHRMPTWLPSRKTDLSKVVARWLRDEDAEWVVGSSPRVEYAPYDWGLACSIA
ncbi:MAG: DUF547 domain-containing protein [Acidimicrobiia bacterium]|nr:DUF547 domain-containing protein [Acidimicrobiia bacterium]